MRTLIVLGFLLFSVNETFAGCQALYPIYDKIESKFGYIDCFGKVVVTPQFLHAYDFSEGLGRIETGSEQNPLMGFVDIHGNILIQPNFGDVGDFSDFSEGLCAVFTKGGFAFIDRSGKVAVRPKDLTRDINPPLEGFSEGYALIYTDKGANFIDRQGRLLMPTYFSSASSFHKGLAAISMDNDKLGAIIDRKGRYVIRPQTGNMDVTRDGIVLMKKGEYWSYFYLGKRFLFRSKYQVDLSNGFGFFYKNHKYGVMNIYGKVILPPKFDFAYEAHEGLAVVELSSKFGAVNNRGKFIIPPVYDSLNLAGFKNGLISFQLGDKFGYLNKLGKPVWTGH